MVDIFLAHKRSEVMRAITAKNTSPELIVRQRLHRDGFRYLLHDARLPGTPDIVLPRFKVAIQVRGCFWHGHSCKVGHIPKTRIDYWAPKIARNKARDRRNDRTLRRKRWRLFVIWECQTRGAPLDMLVSLLRANRNRWPTKRI